jgi:hypothetical protein
MDDSWSKGCIFYDEKQAQQEFSWLHAHNNIREYMLVARVEKKPHDDLDDDVPF